MTFRSRNFIRNIKIRNIVKRRILIGDPSRQVNWHTLPLYNVDDHRQYMCAQQRKKLDTNITSS